MVYSSSPRKYVGAVVSALALTATGVLLGLAPLAVDFTGLAPGLDAAWKQLEAEWPGLVRR